MIVEYSFIIAVIPVILVVAFLVWIAKKITDGERLDMKEGVLGVVILMVAVLVMVPMVSSTQVYTWDEDNGELVIQQNISGGSYAWDTYDSQIRSIVIQPGVTQIGNSAFDGATNLEYLSIPDSVTDIGTNAFGVALKDYLDQTISTPEAGEYVGAGTGTLYQYVEGMFTFDGEKRITGISSGYSDAVNLVLPSTHNGSAVQGVRYEAFRSNSAIASLLVMPGSSWTSIGSSALRDCTSLSTVVLPDTLQTIATSCFYGCTSLEHIDLPDALQSIGNSAFRGTGLTSVVFPDAVQSIEQAAFYGCSSLASVTFPASVTSIGIESFKDCTGITSVAFAEGFAPTLSSSWCPWSFYDSDGTTTISKTDASALAGNTFQGTATALIKVTPGQLTLTPQQIQQVHLHDTELQDLKDQISIEPLPLQPSLQEQELTA